MDTITSYPVLLSAAGVAAAYMLLGPSSSTPVPLRPVPVVSKVEDVDKVIESVYANRQRWVDVPWARKAEYLREMIQINAAIAEEDEEARKASRLRNLEGTRFAVWGGLYGPAMMSTYLRGLLELYESLAASGRPPALVAKRAVGTGEAAVVAPRGLWQKATNPAVVELFSGPGARLEQPAAPPRFLPALVGAMSPGNFEAPVDVLHHLFLEGHVVVAKSHPVNSDASDYLSSRLFAPLVRDGYVGLVAGGPEAGARVLNHPKVEHWMMTGGCATFDAIVFGGTAKKAAGGPQLLTKPCHAELGAASPYVVVPGAWTDKELEEQAEALVGWKMVNSGHICASPQIVVLDRQWSLAQRFAAAVERRLADYPAMPFYYPGTAERMAAVRAACPAARQLGLNNILLVPDVDAEGGGGTYMLRNESFGPALCFKWVSAGGDPKAFVEAAVAVVNQQCFGSLSMSLVVSPASQEAMGGAAALDLVIQRLQWGTVGVNIWAGMICTNPYGTWGAPPGRHEPRDVQSGIGQIGNALLVRGNYKSVIRGVWCDPMMAAFLSPSPKQEPFVRAFLALVNRQTVAALAGVVKTLVWG